MADGGSITDTEATAQLPAGINVLRIGGFEGASQFFNGHIARIVYYPNRLPDEILQALTR